MNANERECRKVLIKMSKVGCLLVVGVLVWLPFSADADDGAEEPDGTANWAHSRPVFLNIRYTPSAQFRTGFRSAAGSVAIRHHDVTGAIIRLVPPGGMLNLSVSQDWDEYRFRGTDTVDGLMNRVESLGVNFLYMGPLRNDWSLFTMVGARSSQEGQASARDSYTGSASFLLQYQWTERVQCGIGAMAGRRLEQRNVLFPFASVNWTITDRLKLRTTRGVHLAYALDERGRWEAALNTEYFRHAVRLHDDGPGQGGIFRSEAIVTTGSLVFRPNPGMTFGAEMGYAPWRDYRVRDADNRTLFNERLAGGATVAMTASITF